MKATAMKNTLFALPLALLATAAAAQSAKFAVFSISSKSSVVKVSSIVGGYSEQDLVRMIADHCAGQVSALAANGKPRKRKGRLIQKYQGTCTGGPRQSVIAAARITVEVEPVSGGKTMYEYTYAQNGTIAYKRVVR